MNVKGQKHRRKGHAGLWLLETAIQSQVLTGNSGSTYPHNSCQVVGPCHEPRDRWHLNSNKHNT